MPRTKGTHNDYLMFYDCDLMTLGDLTSLRREECQALADDRTMNLTREARLAQQPFLLLPCWNDVAADEFLEAGLQSGAKFRLARLLEGRGIGLVQNH